MGRGVIPHLVASDWYDDGAIDIAQQFDFLQPGSEFRKRLADASPSQLPALLREATGSSALNAITAPMVLALPAFDARPDLSLAWLRCVRDPTSLPGATTGRAVLLLDRIGEAPRAADIFTKSLLAAMRAPAHHGYFQDFDHVRFLARYRPTELLRVLRQTRQRGVRSWANEHSGERLMAAALSMETLRRKSQARALYALVIDAGGSKELKALARAKLKEL